jgi:hypothetical protein
VEHGRKWLDLRREGAIITWKSGDGCCGRLELTETGRLLNESGEEEMDLAAERWARELMQECES